MNNYQKGFSRILLLWFVGSIIFAGGYFVWTKNNTFDGNPKCEQGKKPSVHFGKNGKTLVFGCYREIDSKKINAFTKPLVWKLAGGYQAKTLHVPSIKKGRAPLPRRHDNWYS